MAYKTKTMVGRFAGTMGWIIGLVVSIAVGGLFIDGTTLVNPILRIIPTIAHVTVGWIIIVVTIIGAILGLIDTFS